MTEYDTQFPFPIWFPPEIPQQVLAEVISAAALRRGWRLLLTADHGNCDEMVDPQTGEPHTQHTAYPVPCLIVGETNIRLGTGRSLADLAPTILELLGLPQPAVMTGRSLLLRH